MQKDLDLVQGAKRAFEAISGRFGDCLCTLLPSLCTIIDSGLASSAAPVQEDVCLKALHVLTVVAPRMDAQLGDVLLRWAHQVFPRFGQAGGEVRNTAARCAACIVQSNVPALLPSALR